MNFSTRGIIVPPEKINLGPDEFKRVFVNGIDSSTRVDIYLAYQSYTDNFAAKVTPRFTQWIGGSFTTLKANPRDIDLLTIVDRNDYQANKDLIEVEFKRKSPAFPLVDAYFLQWPATETTPSSLFRSDLLYWVHQFGRTRSNRQGKKFARGYVEIIYNAHSYER